jgi:predicted Zn-dependent peptidase
MEAGLLMSMESAQGRADQMARSIEVFGRILSVDELVGQIRAVNAETAREAGSALLDGRAAVASVGAQLALAA